MNTKGTNLPRLRGFTLMELLIVVTIVGILSAIILANLRSSQAEARDQIRIQDMQSIATALKFYYGEKNGYPTSLSQMVPAQISAIPIDPKSSSSTPIYYMYAALGSGTDCGGFHIGAELESGSNYALKTDSDALPGKTCAGSGKDFAGTDPTYDIKQ